MPHNVPLLIANNFHQDTIEKLSSSFDATLFWTLNEPQQEELVVSRRGEIRAVATASWATNPLIYKLPNLEIIACFGVGVDGIDFDITRPRGIKVTNTPTVLNDAVADIAISLILATQRNLINADRFVRDNSWADGPFPFGKGLAGKTLGILGLGEIGEEIAERAKAFKLKIAYHNRSPKDIPFVYYSSAAELAAHSDILLSMLPGGTETHHLINADIFDNLGPEGTFINVGRGSTVDELALIAALQQGKIASAGLDVYECEPDVPDQLKLMKNVVLFPHIGSATVETRRAMGNLVINNLLAWQSKLPLLTPVD